MVSRCCWLVWAPLNAVPRWRQTRLISCRSPHGPWRRPLTCRHGLSILPAPLRSRFTSAKISPPHHIGPLQAPRSFLCTPSSIRAAYFMFYYSRSFISIVLRQRISFSSPMIFPISPQLPYSSRSGHPQLLRSCRSIAGRYGRHALSPKYEVSSLI